VKKSKSGYEGKDGKKAEFCGRSFLEEEKVEFIIALRCALDRRKSGRNVTRRCIEWQAFV
jgi:hypothetical protein